MLYVKLLFTLTCVAFVAAQHGNSAVNSVACPPCERVRRDVDPDEDNDAWFRPRVPGVTTRPATRLPNAVAADLDEDIVIPVDNANGNVVGDVNVNIPSISWPGINVVGDETRPPPPGPAHRRPGPPGPRGPRAGPPSPPGPRPRPPGPRGPRPAENINVNWPSFGWGNIETATQWPRPTENIQVPVSWPGINVNMNNSTVRAPASNGNWSINWNDIRLPRFPNITISGASNATRRGLRETGRVVGNFFRFINETSDEINQVLLSRNYTQQQINDMFSAFGRELREDSRLPGATAQGMMNRVNDFMKELDLEGVQRRWVARINNQISELGVVGSNITHWINGTGGWTNATGRIEDWIANPNATVDKVTDQVDKIIREQGPQGLVREMQRGASALGLDGFFTSLVVLLQGMFELYMTLNPVMLMLRNLATVMSPMALAMPTMGLPGFNMIGGLIQAPLDFAASMTALPSGSANIQLPLINGRMPATRVADFDVTTTSNGRSSGLRFPNLDFSNLGIPRVPDVNVGWGATVGNRGAGIALGTNGIQMSRSGEPIMSSRGVIGNMLGDNIETMARAPATIAQSMLNPFKIVPGVSWAQNALGSAANMIG